MIEAYYVLSYDMPSENHTGISQEEKSFLRCTRLSYLADVMKYGTHITNSVFVIPPSNLKTLEELNRSYTDQYEEYYANSNGNTKCPEIEIIKFHPSETEKIRDKAVDKLAEDVNEFTKKLGEVQFKLASGNRRLRQASMNKLKRTCNELEELVSAFEIEDDFKDTLEIIRIKLEDIKEENEQKSSE